MASIGMIDTDQALGTILSNFSSEYILHVVGDSLNMRFRPFADEMPNMCDILERQFSAIYANAPDYIDQISYTRTETYQEIIKIICNYYNLEFTGVFEEIEPNELYGIARTLYDIFISRFTMYCIDFFTRYILDNKESIYNMVNNDPAAYRPKETSNKVVDDSMLFLIHANINNIVMAMPTIDISLSILLEYFCDPATFNRLNNLLLDRGDIYKNYYASFITNNKTTAEMITSIKLALQSLTYEIKNI